MREIETVTLGLGVDYEHFEAGLPEPEEVMSGEAAVALSGLSQVSFEAHGDIPQEAEADNYGLHSVGLTDMGLDHYGPDNEITQQPKRIEGALRADSSDPSIPEVGADAQENLGGMDIVDFIIEQAQQYPLLTAKEEVDLAKRIELGDMAAKQKLVSSNLRLAIHIAKMYRNKGLEFADLIQEGSLGLMRAAEKFDYRRGFKFSTYAFYWVNQSLQRAIANKGRAIRLPVHQFNAVKKMNGTRTALLAALNREPTVAEIASELGIPEAKVAEMIEIEETQKSLESLDQPVKKADRFDTTPRGALLQNPNENIDSEITTIFARQAVESALGKLTAQERYLVVDYFELHGQPRSTVTQLMKGLGGVKRNRVKALREQALARLEQIMLDEQTDHFVED